MRVYNVKISSLNEVLSSNQFRKEEEKLIMKASKYFNAWIKVTIADYQDIILHHHRISGCGGFHFNAFDKVLVPFRGKRLKDVVPIKNTHCYNTINQYRKRVFKPVILTEQPLPFSLNYGWIKMKGFTHLDGLHRLLASSKPIDAFIAVKNQNKYLLS